MERSDLYLQLQNPNSEDSRFRVFRFQTLIHFSIAKLHLNCVFWATSLNRTIGPPRIGLMLFKSPFAVGMQVQKLGALQESIPLSWLTT